MKNTVDVFFQCTVYFGCFHSALVFGIWLWETVLKLQGTRIVPEYFASKRINRKICRLSFRASSRRQFLQELNNLGECKMLAGIRLPTTTKFTSTTQLSLKGPMCSSRENCPSQELPTCLCGDLNQSPERSGDSWDLNRSRQNWARTTLGEYFDSK